MEYQLPLAIHVNMHELTHIDINAPQHTYPCTKYPASFICPYGESDNTELQYVIIESCTLRTHCGMELIVFLKTVAAINWHAMVLS